MKLFVNLFKDPVGWAQRSVGSGARFCFSAAATAVYGLMTMRLIGLVSCAHPRRDLIVSAYVVVAVGTIGFPIIYLVALRLLLRQYKRETGKNESCAGEQHEAVQG